MSDSRTNKRILIVDDTKSIHDDFRAVLIKEESSMPSFDDLLSASASGENLESISKKSDLLQYEIDSAYQGEEGYLLAKAALQEGRPYAVIFMDVRMPPGMDGIETTKRIWKDCPETEIVICTAYSDHSWEKILNELGVTDRLMFIRKPFDPVTIKQMTMSLVQKWNLQKQMKDHLESLEQKVADRTVALQESVEVLENTKGVVVNILDSINSYVFLVDGNLIVQQANRTAYEFVPTQKDDEGWMTWLPFFDAIGVPEGERASSEQLLKDSMAGLNEKNLAREFEWEPHMTWDNKESSRTFRVELSSLRSTEGSFIISLYEITAIRKEQKYLHQKQRVESVGLLAGGIAHEFNNIIAGIQGYAQLSLRSGTIDLYERAAEVTERQCHRATDLVRGLLAFSRTGKASKGSVDLSAICEDVLVLTSKGEKTCMITVDKKLAPETYVKGAAGALQQIVMNLVINGIHSMAETETKCLSVETGCDDGMAYVCVKDTGCGIPEDKIAHVYDPFYTSKGALGGGANDEKIHGTGLGLSVALGIVNDHDGRIAVESELDKGTTFTVWLPLSEGVEEKKSVLIVEDERELSKIYGRWVSGAGCVPIYAYSGEEALAAYEEHKPTMILLDQSLPKLSGMELIEIIRKDDAVVPIVVITGTVDKKNAQRFLAQGANDCFFKPMTHGRVHGILGQYVFGESLASKEHTEESSFKEIATGKKNTACG